MLRIYVMSMKCFVTYLYLIETLIKLSCVICNYPLYLSSATNKKLRDFSLCISSALYQSTLSKVYQRNIHTTAQSGLIKLILSREQWEEPYLLEPLTLTYESTMRFLTCHRTAGALLLQAGT